MFPFLHHFYPPQQNPISTATGCLMPAVQQCRHRCSHNHIVDKGAVAVTLSLQLPGGILIVILAVVNNWHRSSFISPFSCLVVVLSTSISTSASCHIPFIQLMLYCLPAPHPPPLITPPPLMASFLCLCPTASATCHVPPIPLPQPLAMPHLLIMSHLFGWFSCCFPPVPQTPQLVRPSLILCFDGWLLSIYVTLLLLEGNRRMLHWLALWCFPPLMSSLLHYPC